MTRVVIELAFTLLVSGVASFFLHRWTSDRRIGMLGGVSVVVLALGIIVWFADRPAPDIETVITEPNDGAEVEERTVVKGKSTPIPEVVYVLVHPRSTNSWWVQDLPVVQRTGDWSVDVSMGTASAGIGESFDIIALATNEGRLIRILRDVDLVTAQQLTTTIPSLSKSNLVTVKRIR